MLHNIEKIYFLGIGGIGMSALAQYFLNIGKKVYGYDRDASEITDKLIEMGAEISFKDNAEDFPEGIELVIYTPAIPKTSKLFEHILSQDVEMIKRSSALGLITKDKFTIAIAGSHGKTTVSTMISYILKECGVDCSAFLGGVSTNFGSNYIYGNDDIVVVEADEFDRSFMQLHPDIIVITSIDTDHLDIYGTKENIIKSFQEFVNKLDENGILIINEKAQDYIKTDAEKIVYGFNNEEYNATEIEIKENFCKFQINEEIQKYKLNFNGRHNIENAVATILVATLMDIEDTEIAKALVGFKGIKRRFETIYTSEKMIYIDDYAHHPSEITATLSSLKEIYPEKKLTVIFQPHLYSRTKDLYKEFAESLDIADTAILLPIYPARELPIEGVSAELIAENMEVAAKILSKDQLLDYIQEHPIEVLATLGAGDIGTLPQKIKKILENK